MRSTDSIPEFGIYLHWPFCQSICPYCDFNTYTNNIVDGDAWTQAYLQQLDNSMREAGGRVCHSVFFGGGTPSLMPLAMVTAILARINKNWGLASEAEITLEANPSSSEAIKFAGFKSAGINRLSIGVQSLRNRGLAALGRLHTVADSKFAFELAAKHFKHLNIDLMFGRPEQSLKEWQEELAEATQWGAEHLSLYQLTIEPKTPFGRRHAVGKLPGLPSEELAADMQMSAAAICETSGYTRYEISNYAPSGCESRHNLLYWRGQDFLGIGPGAHGRLTIDGRRVATETHLLPAKWLESVRVYGSGESKRTILTSKEQSDEYLMMSLRLTEGTDLKRLMKLSGTKLNAERIGQLQNDGLIEVVDNRLIATKRGRMLINTLVRELTDYHH